MYVHILKKKKRRSENTRRTKGSRLIWKIKKELAPTDSPNYRISRRNIVGENCKRGRCTSWHDASSAIILTFPDDISTEYFNIHANPVFQIEGKIRPLKSREKYELFVTFKKTRTVRKMYRIIPRLPNCVRLRVRGKEIQIISPSNLFLLLFPKKKKKNCIPPITDRNRNFFFFLFSE